MTCNIIGCGESGALWNGEGDAIGVNDCAKFGNHPGVLVLLNYPQQFGRDRLSIIAKTNTQRVLSHIPAWRKIFASRFELISYKSWNRTMNVNTYEEKLGAIYVSNTSPFCAISVAVNLGYTELILYGVDFKTHNKWNPSNSYFADEKQNYQSFIQVLGKKGIKVYSIVPGELELPQPGQETGAIQTLYV